MDTTSPRCAFCPEGRHLPAVSGVTWNGEPMCEVCWDRVMGAKDEIEREEVDGDA